jgi:hypothetical protein
MKRLAFLVLLLMASPAAADTIGIGRATITYDPAVWQVSELSGAAGLRFSCIAEDCQPGAATYATASDDTGEKIQPGSEREAVPYAAPPGAIPFTVLSGWSGCRARDNPILAAQGTVGGVAYVFVTALGDGCNLEPSPPEKRFLNLLAGVKPG